MLLEKTRTIINPETELEEEETYIVEQITKITESEISLDYIDSQITQKTSMLNNIQGEIDELETKKQELLSFNS